jgi:hypothetical protein
LLEIYWNILTMHGPINVKSPNNTSKWQLEFNSAFKGLILHFSSQGHNSFMELFSMRNCFFSRIAYFTVNTVNPYRNYGNSIVASLGTMETRARHSNTECIIKVRFMYWFVYVFAVYFHEEPLYFFELFDALFRDHSLTRRRFRKVHRNWRVSARYVGSG